MLGILPGMMLLAVFLGRYIRKLSKNVQAEVAKSNTIVEETFQGIQIVKAYTNEFFEINGLKNRTIEIANIGMKSGKYRGAFSAFMIFGLFGAMVAVIWKRISDDVLRHYRCRPALSFVIFSGFVGGTIGGPANVFTQIQKFIGATEELFELFDEGEEKLAEIVTIPENELIMGRIGFRNLSFRYPGRPEEEVLRNINL